jgi:hypothetical protein
MIALGILVALAAAARSTWSPCGLSMLSSITPFGERSRGHRYGVTAAWFVLGAAVGGATLGAGTASLAVAVGGLGLSGHPVPVALLVAGCGLMGGALDAGLFGDVLPAIRRQVDDGWIARYRPWVYAGGFGWQIGVGVATYVMTAALFLLIVVAAVTGSPWVALLLGTGFGVLRGSTVLLTSRARDPARLRLLHRRIERAGPGVRMAVAATQAVVAVIAASELGLVAGAVVGVLVVVAAVRLAIPSVSPARRS